MKLCDVAQIASDAFQTTTVGTGDDARQIDTLKDDHPDWVRDLVYAAHGDFLPDDWRYSAIRAAVDAITDSGAETEEDCDDLDHEYADSQCDVYTHDRLKWLSSNLNRAGYVDEAASEFGADPDGGIIQMIGMGQYMEAREIWGSVLRSLVERMEEIEEETTDDDD